MPPSNNYKRSSNADNAEEARPPERVLNVICSKEVGLKDGRQHCDRKQYAGYAKNFLHGPRSEI